MAIRNNCPEELFTIIMRRLMLEIAQRICQKENCSCLITGESLGQVSSQTMGAIVCTNEACGMPMFPPCIGLDKAEIVEVESRIGTFDTSILPYEDCYTVFTPKHLRTRSTVVDVKVGQARFDFEPMICKAIENIAFKIVR